MSRLPADDRLAAARPESLTGRERTAMFSRVAATSRLEAAGPGEARSGSRRGTPGLPRRHRAALAVAAAALVSLAIGLPVGLGGSGHSGSTDIHLASYEFKLPVGYLEAASTNNCGPGFYISYRAGTFQSLRQMISQVNGQPDEPGVASAANAAGGCVSMALVGPYAPGGPYTPTVGGIGGPLGSGGATPHQLQVGPYQALLGSFAKQGWTAEGGRILPVGSSTGSELVLDVTIPVSGGEVESLVVSSNQLSQQALVATVTEGLTGAGDTGSPTTTPSGPTSAQ